MLHVKSIQIFSVSTVLIDASETSSFRNRTWIWLSNRYVSSSIWIYILHSFYFLFPLFPIFPCFLPFLDLFFIWETLLAFCCLLLRTCSGFLSSEGTLALGNGRCFLPPLKFLLVPCIQWPVKLKMSTENDQDESCAVSPKASILLNKVHTLPTILSNTSAQEWLDWSLLRQEVGLVADYRGEFHVASYTRGHVWLLTLYGLVWHFQLRKELNKLFFLLSSENNFL